MNEKLPPLPRAITKHLTEEQSDRLKRRYALSPHSVPKTPKDCITCHGKKTFRWYTPDRSEIVTYDCNCADQWLAHRRMLYHGVPTSYQQLGWADVHADIDSTMQVVDYMENRVARLHRGKGLYLWGGTGTGKTLMGSLVLKSFLSDDYVGCYTSFTDLLEDKSDGFADAEDHAYFRKQVRGSEVLMIDDPGKEIRVSQKQGEFASGTMDDVLRHRNGDNKTTIITSNDSPHEFGVRYGQYVRSLLDERMKIYHITGTDFRDSYYRNMDIEEELGLSRPITIQ